MSSVQDVCRYLETIAPPLYQESYDNAGLLVGDGQAEVRGVITCLDVTEEVIAEAAENGANLVVAHHPIIFGGIKRLTGTDSVQRCLIRAIEQGIAIYAIHTNLDNVLQKGVNGRIAKQLELKDTEVLKALDNHRLCRASIPSEQVQEIRAALGTLRIQADSIRTVAADQNGDETEVAVQCPEHMLSKVTNILATYSTGVEVSDFNVENSEYGAGAIGYLSEEVSEADFLRFVQKSMNCTLIRHTDMLGRPVKKVAVCGGSGAFLLSAAIAKGADVFISGDFKYHDFFNADGKIMIADIGHFESEQFTIDLLCELIQEKFSNFAARLTSVDTNPVHYFK